MKDVGSSICSQKLAGRLVRTVLSGGDPYQRRAFLGLGFGLGGELQELFLTHRHVKYVRWLSGFGRRQLCRISAKGRWLSQFITSRVIAV